MYKRANKRKERLPFNFITEVVISIVNLVLLIIWQDKNLVRFLTIVHLCSNKDVNKVNWRQLWCKLCSVEELNEQLDCKSMEIK